MLVYIALGVLTFVIAVFVWDFLQYRLRAATAQKAERVSEAFEDFSVFREKVIPGGNDPVADDLDGPAPAFDPVSEKLVAPAIPAMSMSEAEQNWGAMTSERCFRADIGESLKPTRNYLQRTNNYRRSHPDSCSAPNHEFIGTFYTPMEGVGRTPTAGDNYPPSTLPCAILSQS